MRGLTSCLKLIGAVVAAIVSVGEATAQTCEDPAHTLGVSRIIEIDASAGPLFGKMSKYTREDTFLAPKEVVLTFDDGPVPWITKAILDELDRSCTKATFFYVGQMALAYPRSVKDVVARGHTLGGHTWSHPLNLKHLSLEKAKDQIERGFAAVALAAGEPIAPFFRFPGLSDSDPLLQYLQTRGIASFTVDVVSNDSFTPNAARLTQHTIAQVEQNNGGIVLFHDIKASTARALPDILKQLKQRGYSVVHLRAKAALQPVAGYEADLAKVLARAQPTATAHLAADAKADPRGTETGVHQVAPANVTTASIPAIGIEAAPVTQLAPAARARMAAVETDATVAKVSRRAKRMAVVESDGSAGAVIPPRQKSRVRHGKRASPASKAAFFPQ